MSTNTDPQPDYGDDPKLPWHDPVPVSVWTRAKYVVAFLVCVFVLDRAVGFAIKQLSDRSHYRYSELYAGKVNADVVVVGNSRGLHSLYTPAMAERLGVPVYNLSMNGLGMDVVSVIVQDYLDLNTPPKMILVEISCADHEVGDTILFFQPFMGQSARVSAEMRKYQPTRYWASFFSHTFRYNGNVIEKYLLYLRGDDQHYISSNARKIPAELLEHRDLKWTPHFDPVQVKAWKDLVAAAEARGVKVVPFIAPYLPGSIGSLDAKKVFTDAMMKDVPNPPVALDYTRAVDADGAFFDRVHTNEDGAKVLFEKMLADGVFAGLTPKK